MSTLSPISRLIGNAYGSRSYSTSAESQVGPASAQGADRIADRFVHRLGEAAELADVEVDPAHVIVLALLGDEHDLGLDHAGIADHAAARLDDGLWDAVAEMPPQRAEDRRAVGLHRRHVLEVLGRKSAAQINHRQR